MCHDEKNTEFVQSLLRMTMTIVHFMLIPILHQLCPILLLLLNSLLILIDKNIIDFALLFQFQNKHRAAVLQ